MKKDITDLYARMQSINGLMGLRYRSLDNTLAFDYAGYTDRLAVLIGAPKPGVGRVSDYLLTHPVGRAFIGKAARRAGRYLARDGYDIRQLSRPDREDVEQEYRLRVLDWCLNGYEQGGNYFFRLGGNNTKFEYRTLDSLPIFVWYFTLTEKYRDAFRFVAKNKGTCSLLNRFSDIKADSLDVERDDGTLMLDILGAKADRYHLSSLEEVVRAFQTALTPAQFRDLTALISAGGDTSKLTPGQQRNVQRGRRALNAQDWFNRMDLADKLDYVETLERRSKDLVNVLNAL